MTIPLKSESDQSSFFESRLNKAMKLNSPFYASLSENQKVAYLRQYKLQVIAFGVVMVVIVLGLLFGFQTKLITGFAVLSILALSASALMHKQTYWQLFVHERRSNREKSATHREELESFAKQLQKEHSYDRQ
ncbi:hypothetical protein IPL85_02665 [Candidatus Saccharibacteria bacterium]|nr:MAG: hypothetical protein IPL85_02665 [Candidatus Saccharibacteria bacterium]